MFERQPGHPTNKSNFRSGTFEKLYFFFPLNLVQDLIILNVNICFDFLPLSDINKVNEYIILMIIKNIYFGII